METTKKIKMAMIGGGFITQFYEKGIEHSNNISLVGLSDLNSDCLAKKIYKDVSFYTDYKKMITDLKPEMVLICTGADTHYQIIKSCLLSGIDVIVEKPLCATMEEINDLYNIAHKNHKNLECIYHFAFGSEALWLKENISRYGKIIRYSFSAHEQYAWNEKHVVIPEKRSLGHSWNDASINLLSDMDMVIPNIESAKLTREILVKDKVSGLITYAHKTFMTKDGIEFDILTDWMTKDKTKISIIDLDTGRIMIDHHEQIITFNGECIFKDIPKEHRMHGQYLNYFKNFKFDPENEAKTKRLHKIIFLEKEDNLEKKAQNKSKRTLNDSMER